MRGMELRNARRSLWLAVGTSLLLHAAVLFIGFSSPGPATTGGTARLQATLSSPAPPTPSMPPAPASAPTPPSRTAPQASRPAASRAPGETRKLNAPAGAWKAPSWTAAERADMNKFLDELAAQARPPSGHELAEKARVMARQMRSPTPDDEPADPSGNNAVEPYSLEMYFDAFVKKLNRSAAFVKNDPRPPGSRKALVQIALNADGSLKSYRVLRSGDQAAEIAYIRSVIERASPFSAFPRDIRQVSDSLSILMCILPARAGAGGGFSRSFGAQDCRD
ncbi:MAG: hypothetical protein H6R17_332 [Proteobacteria bacterium]|nr:hypothetical protein [Pseudomonadota bacterium]